ncbi:hypothetical protein [Leptospira santarosai]|uniref:Uncharacterized protein n=1 Tax=Leptospira santarosai str. ZUN179 TaxID=1049985 RepID=M6UIK2_9LEPT|nr:hypothetical protein [Leptospira santarosai]EMO44380.1 hypothetical protein LEP1GSC187_3786 [Leptospira santarosai str. ZUN179]
MRISKKYPKGTSIKSKNDDLKIKFLHEIVVLRRSPNKKPLYRGFPESNKKALGLGAFKYWFGFSFLILS